MDSSHSSFPLPLKDNVDFVPGINTWEDCKRWYHETRAGQLIFRGLPSSEYNLESTFDSAYKKNTPIPTDIPKWKYEAVMLFNFKRIAHHYVEALNIPQENDNLEWIGLLRHYGAPSRLLDFTYSFYIAAYFAIEKAEINNQNDSAVVWVIDLEWLAKEAYDLLEREKMLLEDKQIKSRIFQDPKLFNEIFLNFKNTRDFIIPINPFRFNRRIRLQQGVFLCPYNIEHTLEQNLVGVPGIDKRKIFRIRLLNDQKKDIIKDLSQMNITYETLFGDLEGVARSLNDFFCLDYRMSTKDELLYRILGLDQPIP